MWLYQSAPIIWSKSNFVATLEQARDGRTQIGEQERNHFERHIRDEANVDQGDLRGRVGSGT